MGLGGGNTKTTGTTKVELPKWADDAAQRILARADIVSNQPYTLYPHARLAPLNEDHQAAFDLTRMLPGRFSSAASGGSGLMDGLAGLLSGGSGAAATGAEDDATAAAATADNGPALDVSQLMEQIFGAGGSAMVGDKPTVTQSGSFVPPNLSTMPGVDPFSYGTAGGEALFMRGTQPGGPMTPISNQLPVANTSAPGSTVAPPATPPPTTPPTTGTRTQTPAEDWWVPTDRGR